MMLLKGLELGRDLGGDSGGTDIMGLLGKGLDMAKPLISRGLENATQHRPVAALPAVPPVLPVQVPTLGTPTAVESVNPNPPSEVNVAPLTEQETMMKMLAWLQKQLAALVRQAVLKKEPGLYAEVFLDNVPDFVPIELLVAQIGADNAIDRLSQLNIGVAQNREWFEQFREACIEILNQKSNESRTIEGDTASDT